MLIGEYLSLIESYPFDKLQSGERPPFIPFCQVKPAPVIACFPGMLSTLGSLPGCPRCHRVTTVVRLGLNARSAVVFYSLVLTTPKAPTAMHTSLPDLQRCPWQEKEEVYGLINAELSAERSRG